MDDEAPMEEAVEVVNLADNSPPEKRQTRADTQEVRQVCYLVSLEAPEISGTTALLFRNIYFKALVYFRLQNLKLNAIVSIRRSLVPLHIVIIQSESEDVNCLDMQVARILVMNLANAVIPPDSSTQTPFEMQDMVNAVEGIHEVGPSVVAKYCSPPRPQNSLCLALSTLEMNLQITNQALANLVRIWPSLLHHALRLWSTQLWQIPSALVMRWN
jgi:hypothetical protein